MSVYATTPLRHRDRAPPSKRRKFSRELILRGLEIIGTIQAPLAPEPSSFPSSSRTPSSSSDVSFASSSKRKLDSNVDRHDGSAKRAKPATSQPASSHGPIHTFSTSSTASVKPSPPSDPYGSSALAYTSKLPESEKLVSEVTNVGATTSRSPTLFEPVRRPRRGQSSIDFKVLQQYYYNQARNFKYSGEGRFLSAHPPSHEQYRPLRDPPPKGSPYHTHSTLMAALEALEALLCFVYSSWCQDFFNPQPHDAWLSNIEFLKWVLLKWNMYVGPRDNVREKSIIGLIHMIETFIRLRVVRYRLAPTLERRTGQLLVEVKRAKAREAEKAKPKVHVPPEKSLPSPETDAASASSTPATQNNGTPAHKGDVKPDDLKRSGKPMANEPQVPLDPLLVPPQYVEQVQDFVRQQMKASNEMKNSQKTLSLAIMREHFPHTYARMVQSTLAAEEEYEPDMEDSEGELLWPNQCVTGDGIAWVCLMGRAMTREFGRDIGYLNIDGIIPKPTSM